MPYLSLRSSVSASNYGGSVRSSVGERDPLPANGHGFPVGDGYLGGSTAVDHVSAVAAILWASSSLCTHSIFFR